MTSLFSLVIQHLQLLIWSLVATLMVIYGAALNQRIRKALRGLPLLLRFLAFVVVCAVGYGWLSLVLVRITVQLLSEMSPAMVFAFVFGGFLCVGWLAERRRLF